MEFRDGEPEDYLTYSTRQPYIPFDAEDENVQTILKFVASILPDPDVMEYFLKILSLCSLHLHFCIFYRSFLRIFSTEGKKYETFSQARDCS